MEWQALWTEMKRLWIARIKTWVETTEGMYDDQLCILPPERMGGGAFLVGEGAFHNANDEQVFACFKEEDGKFFARYMTVATFETEFCKRTTNV